MYGAHAPILLAPGPYGDPNIQPKNHQNAGPSQFPLPTTLGLVPFVALRAIIPSAVVGDILSMMVATVPAHDELLPLQMGFTFLVEPITTHGPSPS